MFYLRSAMYIFPACPTSLRFACGIFAVQRWFCLLCTQGNPAHYSQTHRISSILLVRLLFLFFQSWNLSSQTV